MRVLFKLFALKYLPAFVLSIVAIGLFIGAFMACTKPQPAPYPYDFLYYSDFLAGHSVRFTTDAPTSKTFLWDFGDGTTDTAHVAYHNYIATGAYKVSLVISNDAAHKIVKTITILPNYSFDYSGDPVAGGMVSFHFSFPPPAGNVYSWDFGDGTVVTMDSMPSHIYAATGTYHVTLIVNKSTTINKQLRIYHDPIYTHALCSSRLWHRSDSSSWFNTVTKYSFPDTSFAPGLINSVMFSIGQDKFIYDPDSSFAGALVFATLQGDFNNPKDTYDLLDFNTTPYSLYKRLVYYYATDSIVYKYTYNVYPYTSSGHPPPTIYSGVWHAP